MMTSSGSGEAEQFAFGGEAFQESLRNRAAEVFADVAELNPAAPEGFPEALPVEAAVAWGDCLLFIGAPPRQAFPEWLAEPAAGRLEFLLKQSIDAAQQLPADWEAAGPDAADDLVVGLVKVRMNAWAAFETLDRVPSTVPLAARLAACDEALARFDESLISRIDYLATIAETKLLTKWRLSLAEGYRDPLPWWLDGRLEATAVGVEHAIARMGRSLGTGSPGSARVPSASAKLRSRFEQVYAAAAQGSASAGGLASIAHWRSPDQLLDARLLPPAGGPSIIPDKLVVAFSAESEADLASLRGCVAVLGEVGVPITWRTVEGEEIATAEFPAAEVLQSPAIHAGEPPTLVVFPVGEAWRHVAAGDRS